MAPRTRIVADTPQGKMIIESGRGLRRSYTWNGATRSVEMHPRWERWYGSLGIYYPGPGRHWLPVGVVTRGVVNEGQQHFDSVEKALEWIGHLNDWCPVVYRNDGLLVGWTIVPEREQLNVEVWQITIAGKKPTTLPGANDAAITVELLDPTSEPARGKAGPAAPDPAASPPADSSGSGHSTSAAPGQQPGALTIDDYRAISALIRMLPAWPCPGQAPPSAGDWERLQLVADALRGIEPDDLERALIVYEMAVQCSAIEEDPFEDLTRPMLLLRAMFADELAAMRATSDHTALRGLRSILERTWPPVPIDGATEDQSPTWPIDFTQSPPRVLAARICPVAHSSGPSQARSYHPHVEHRTLVQITSATSAQAVEANSPKWEALLDRFAREDADRMSRTSDDRR